MVFASGGPTDAGAALVEEAAVDTAALAGWLVAPGLLDAGVGLEAPEQALAISAMVARNPRDLRRNTACPPDVAADSERRTRFVASVAR